MSTSVATKRTSGTGKGGARGGKSREPATYNGRTLDTTPGSATPNQRELMKALKIRFTDGISKSDASLRIDAAKERNPTRFAEVMAERAASRGTGSGSGRSGGTGGSGGSGRAGKQGEEGAEERQPGGRFAITESVRNRRAYYARKGEEYRAIAVEVHGEEKAITFFQARRLRQMLSSSKVPEKYRIRMYQMLNEGMLGMSASLHLGRLEELLAKEDGAEAGEGEGPEDRTPPPASAAAGRRRQQRATVVHSPSDLDALISAAVDGLDDGAGEEEGPGVPDISPAPQAGAEEEVRKVA